MAVKVHLRQQVAKGNTDKRTSGDGQGTGHHTMTLRFHLQIRIYPLSQLTMTVFALLMVNAFVQFLVEGLAGLAPAGLMRWSRVVAGTLLWPLVMGILDRLRLSAEYRSSRL